MPKVSNMPRKCYPLDLQLLQIGFTIFSHKFLPSIFFFLSKWSIQWEIYNKYFRPKLFGHKLFDPKRIRATCTWVQRPGGPQTPWNVNISIPTGEWIAEMSLTVTWGKCEAANVKMFPQTIYCHYCSIMNNERIHYSCKTYSFLPL